MCMFMRLFVWCEFVCATSVWTSCEYLVDLDVCWLCVWWTELMVYEIGVMSEWVEVMKLCFCVIMNWRILVCELYTLSGGLGDLVVAVAVEKLDKLFMKRSWSAGVDSGAFNVIQFASQTNCQRWLYQQCRENEVS